MVILRSLKVAPRFFNHAQVAKGISYTFFAAKRFTKDKAALIVILRSLKVAPRFFNQAQVAKLARHALLTAKRFIES